MKLLNIRQQLPRLGVQPAAMPRYETVRERGGLEIDQTAGRRALGMYPPVELSGRLAELARQAVLEGTAGQYAEHQPDGRPGIANIQYRLRFLQSLPPVSFHFDRCGAVLPNRDPHFTETIDCA